MDCNLVSNDIKKVTFESQIWIEPIHYLFANSSPRHKNAFTQLNSPRITIGLHRHPLRKLALCTESVVFACQTACTCVTSTPKRTSVTSTLTLTRLQVVVGTTVEADIHTRLAFSLLNDDLLVSPQIHEIFNNYNLRHQVSSQNLESRRTRSKRGHVHWWSFDMNKIGERAFVNFYTRTVHSLHTNRK